MAQYNSGYRRRDLMHITHIVPFTQWLLEQGWESKPLLVWEVIRMHKGKETCIVWLKAKAKEHCTVQGVSKRLFHEWRRTWKDNEQ